MTIIMSHTIHDCLLYSNVDLMRTPEEETEILQIDQNRSFLVVYLGIIIFSYS